MNFLRTVFINIENNVHYLITWVFNVIHTTIDCFSAIIEQWVVNENIEEEQITEKKIGFRN